MFFDSEDSPFSIHRIAEEGAKLHTRIGEWFGPSILAHSLKALNASLPVNLRWLEVSVAMDGLVPETGIIAKLGSKKPVLLLLPVRLGVENLNPSYFPCIKVSYQNAHHHVLEPVCSCSFRKGPLWESLEAALASRYSLWPCRETS